MKQKNSISPLNQYPKSFFDFLSKSSWQSAQVILPIIIDLIQPQNAIDIGCGQGIWLCALDTLGIHDILGLDGDYVVNSGLKIPLEKFQVQDLTQPFDLNRSFDLVISLEVAEHLPGEKANSFIESLVHLGKVILFSAAIPFQGGVNHINEQWPDYWVEKFRAHGYLPIDCIRGRIWNNPEVAYWYAQNILLFVESDFLLNHPKLRTLQEMTQVNQLSIVHPKKYLEQYQQCQNLIQLVEGYKHASDPQNWPIREILKVMPIIVFNGIKRSLSKLSDTNPNQSQDSL